VPREVAMVADIQERVADSTAYIVEMITMREMHVFMKGVCVSYRV
jgi:hypothetical protein